MASSASLDVLLNVGSARSRPRGVKVPDRLVYSFSSDISSANLRPADCHSVIRLSYSCGKIKIRQIKNTRAYLFQLSDNKAQVQAINVLDRQPVCMCVVRAECPGERRKSRHVWYGRLRDLINWAIDLVDYDPYAERIV